MATKSPYFFPFGEPLKKVFQRDRSPKKAFILGVYASAVHARWVDEKGRQKVSALAVASEPYIFWRGENAESIISSISIPPGLGKLVPPVNSTLNGPSGVALDKYYLNPLGFEREDVWLCDLLPESRVNPKQSVAISRAYTPELIKQYSLNENTIPLFNKNELASPERRKEILAEFKDSKATTLILLGDLPIYWFLRFYSSKIYKKLSDFGVNEMYGQPVDMLFDGKPIKVIALAHPRHAAKLGTYSDKWHNMHMTWTSSLLKKNN